MAKVFISYSHKDRKCKDELVKPFEAADLSQRGWQVKSLEEGAERLFDIPNDNAGLESIAWSLIAANKTLDQNSWIGKFSVHRVSR